MYNEAIEIMAGISCPCGTNSHTEREGGGSGKGVILRERITTLNRLTVLPPMSMHGVVYIQIEKRCI